MEFRFGIARLMLATAAMAIALALLGPYGATGIVAALLAGCSVAGIILLAKRSDIWPMIRMAIFALIGGAGSWSQLVGLWSVSDTVLSVLIGGFLGLVWSAHAQRIKELKQSSN